GGDSSLNEDNHRQWRTRHATQRLRGAVVKSLASDFSANRRKRTNGVTHLWRRFSLVINHQQRGNHMEGVDLCIKQIHEPIMDKYWPLCDAAVKKRDSLPRGSQAAHDAQEEITKCYDLMYSEGYFRDGDSCSSVLWALGLSW